MMAFPVGSWSFHRLYEQGQMDLFGYFDILAHRCRVTHAHIWSGMLASTDAAYIAQVAEALRRKHLRVACLAVDGPSIWAADPEQRASQRRQVLQHLDPGSRLSAETVRIVWAS